MGLRLGCYESLSASNDQEKLACPSWSLSDQTVNLSLSGLIPDRLNCRKWLVRTKFCQTNLWNSDCKNEVLPDCLVRIRLWKWSSGSLNYVYYAILAKVYQASCSDLECVYHQLLLSLSCCISLSPVNWFTFFSRWRFYLLPLTTSGGRIIGEQCSLLYRSSRTTLGWESFEFSQHACTSWCASVSSSACWLHPFVARLDRIQLGSGHEQLSWSFSGSSLLIALTFYWKQQHSKF